LNLTSLMIWIKNNVQRINLFARFYAYFTEVKVLCVERKLFETKFISGCSLKFLLVFKNYCLLMYIMIMSNGLANRVDWSGADFSF